MACFIVIAPKHWRQHDSAFLAVPVIRHNQEVPLDVSALLGHEGNLFSFTVTWSGGGAGIEFHTLSGCCWNQATRDVLEELGVQVVGGGDGDEDEEDQPVVCTIVTRPGKRPLTRPLYEWFRQLCGGSIY